MRIATLIVRILLGLIFLVFGLNGFLHFIPQPPMPPSDAATFATILATHGWMTFVSFLEVVAALLLLAGRYVPVGLVLLGPILVNILLFHILLAGGKGIASRPGLHPPRSLPHLRLPPLVLRHCRTHHRDRLARARVRQVAQSVFSVVPWASRIDLLREAP